MSTRRTPAPPVQFDRDIDDDWGRDMWYCPDCKHWVSRAREECSCGREQPSHEDVEFDHSGRVSRKHRFRAKLRRVLEVSTGRTPAPPVQTPLGGCLTHYPFDRISRSRPGIRGRKTRGGDVRHE